MSYFHFLYIFIFDIVFIVTIVISSVVSFALFLLTIGFVKYNMGKVVEDFMYYIIFEKGF